MAQHRPEGIEAPSGTAAMQGLCHAEVGEACSRGGAPGQPGWLAAGAQPVLRGSLSGGRAAGGGWRGPGSAGIQMHVSCTACRACRCGPPSMAQPEERRSGMGARYAVQGCLQCALPMACQLYAAPEATAQAASTPGLLEDARALACRGVGGARPWPAPPELRAAAAALAVAADDNAPLQARTAIPEAPQACTPGRRR